MVDEIAFPRELENWLSDGPPQWAQAVAVRIALRVVPTALDPKWSHEGSSSSRSEFAKAIFRALVVSFAAAETIADGAYVDHHFESAAMTAAFSAATDEDADLQSNSRVAPTLTASQAANAVASAAVAASSETTSEAIPGAVQAFDSASEAAALAANPRGFQVGEYPLALAASVDQLWGVTSDDCRAVNAGMPITTILNSRLWTGSPPWFSEAWNQARQHLSGLGDGSDVWREWYHGRVQGLPHAFKDFDDAADETFYRWIIEQNDHWWKREPREVNADIKAKVEELRTPHPLSTEELQQNPRAFTFSLDSEGRSELDEELLPNGLHGDDDERDNHREILRLIDAALTATAGDTNTKGIAEPTEQLRDAVGETVEALRPRLFVLRSREVMRWVEESKSDDMRVPGLSKAQTDAFIPLIAALEVIAEFSPKLAELWHGKLGQTGEPLTREMLDLIAEALRSSGQTTALAQSIIEASNRQVAPDAAIDDPARIAASETSRNVFRKMGSAIKKTGDGARAVESIVKLGERAFKMWRGIKGNIPGQELIARILEMLSGGV